MLLFFLQGIHPLKTSIMVLNLNTTLLKSVAHKDFNCLVPSDDNNQGCSNGVKSLFHPLVGNPLDGQSHDSITAMFPTNNSSAIDDFLPVPTRKDLVSVSSSFFRITFVCLFYILCCFLLCIVQENCLIVVLNANLKIFSNHACRCILCLRPSVILHILF